MSRRASSQVILEPAGNERCLSHGFSFWLLTSAAADEPASHVKIIQLGW